ncbi:MAG: hypothetical protein VX614_09805 [Myxococcota bacterium]|nr:hypothetical protein [Myxococcota bacterium]
MPNWQSKERYKSEVLAYVTGTDWVSFADLHKRFAPDAREATEIVLPGNRVVWRGMPQPLFDAVLELVEQGQLAAVPGHRSAYKKDGRILKLPIEKSIPPEGHAEPHWFPVLLRPAQAAGEAD